jgi:hypothetical protein
MLRLLSDENFNGHVIDGIKQRYPEIDLIRVQDVGLPEWISVPRVARYL